MESIHSCFIIHNFTHELQYELEKKSGRILLWAKNCLWKCSSCSHRTRRTDTFVRDHVPQLIARYASFECCTVLTVRVEFCQCFFLKSKVKLIKKTFFLHPIMEITNIRAEKQNNIIQLHFNQNNTSFFLDESQIQLSMLHTNKAFVLKTKRKKNNVVVAILISVKKSDKSKILKSVKTGFTIPPTSLLYIWKHVGLKGGTAPITENCPNISKMSYVVLTFSIHIINTYLSRRFSMPFLSF